MKALILSENFFEDSELFYPYFRLFYFGSPDSGSIAIYFISASLYD